VQTKSLLGRKGIREMQARERTRNKKGRMGISDSALLTLGISAAAKKLLHLGEK